MGARFWSYDGDMWNVHDTAEDARSHCLAALEEYRDQAPEGWPEEVEHIMWGPIAEMVVETERQDGHLADCSRDDGCADDCKIRGEGFDSYVEYDLVAVEK